MMMRLLRIALGSVALWLALIAGALAQTAATYTIAPGTGGSNLSFHAFTCSSIFCTGSVPIDYLGNPLTGVAGSPSTMAMTVQGISGGTAVPVSAASLPLPTGAATSANQPSAAAIGSTTSGQIGTLTMGAVTTSAPSYTTAESAPFSLDTAGNLRVNCITGCSGGGGGGTSSNFGSAFPTAGTAIGLTNGTNMVPWSATTNYGTAPSAIPVPAVNAAVTNTVTVIATDLSTNLAQVNGVTTLTGAGAVGTGSVRVAVGQDTTTIAGSAPGTAGSASANVLTVQGVASMTPLLTNPGTIGSWGLAASTQNGTTPTNGGLVMGQFNTTPTTITSGNISPVQMDNAGNLLANVKASVLPTGAATSANQASQLTQETNINTVLGTVGSAASCAPGSNSTAMECWYALYAAVQTGVGSTGSAVPSQAIYTGGNAQSSEPAATTTGNLIGNRLDLTGKQITSPYANRENMLRCAVTITASTAATTCTGMGAQGSGVKIYVTDLCITRNDAGTSAVSMTLNDTATTIVDLPNNGGGGGFCKTYNVPLVIAANTAFQVTSGTSISSEHVSATGFAGY
jgi:hypothetical protein